MKKIILIIVTITMFLPLGAKASVYYTNKNGIEFTKEEYDYLLKFYKEVDIYNMSLEEWNYEKQYDFSFAESSNTYIRQIIYYDREGKSEILDQFEINEEEYLNNNQMNVYGYCGDSYNPNSCYETSDRKLTLTAYVQGNSYLRVVLDNKWKSIPRSKQFDVIGLMWKQSDFNAAEIKPYQYYNSGSGVESVNYSYPGTNTVFKSSGIYKGVATAQNIVDDVKSDLENKLIVDGTQTGSMKFWGSYQHAPSISFLKDCHDFDFDPSGYGGVFKFKSAYSANRFDKSLGVILGK